MRDGQWHLAFNHFDGDIAVIMHAEGPGVHAILGWAGAGAANFDFYQHFAPTIRRFGLESGNV